MSRLEPLDRLMRALQKLPGIGPRSAERVAFHLLRAPRDEVQDLADAVAALKTSVRHCAVCFNLTDRERCAICTDPRRNHDELWVVEQPKDLMTLEATGLVRGTYHVLMGHISPLEGIGPSDLTIDALTDRVAAGGIREVVIATNPTLDGDGTALHILALLEPLGVKTTRLARGLAVGSQLEFATTAMLEAAIKGRR